MNNTKPRNSKWWTPQEHTKFLELLPKLQNNWKQYTAHLTNRSVEQIRSHAQKYFLGLKQDPDYKMYSNKKKRKCGGSCSSSSSAYAPIMKQVLTKKTRIHLKIDIKKAAEVKKPEIKTRSSSTFSFGSEISDLTFDIFTPKENEGFSTFEEILHHFEQIDNL